MRIPAPAALPLLLLTAQVAPPPPSGPAAAAVVAVPDAGWLHAGSDVPVDPAWRAGTLPGGMRYAVRRGATPPGTVAIRLRMDVGALMEASGESGWAHLLEHMVFRGTADLPDGEAVRLWQRLGATFGSDTNATTSLRATTYQLDLPRTDRASLDRAMAALAGMMRAPTIDARLLDVERQVVLAERAARITPSARRVIDASRAVFQSGLAAADADIGGSEATLAAATDTGLRGFHRRWYRPDRATIVVVGDADPAILEAVVRSAFAGWRADGPPPSEPDYGRPTQPAAPARVVSDRLLTPSLAVAWVHPARTGAETLARIRADLLETVALRVVNQRFAEAAAAGAPYLSAGLSMTRGRNVSDQATLSISPREGGWRPALDGAYATLNAALAAPPAAAEIAQALAPILRGAERAVETVATAPSPALANRLIAAVDAGTTAPPPEVIQRLLAGERAAITPAAVATALRTLVAPEPRLLVITRAPVAGGDGTAATALADARRRTGTAQTALRTVTIDDLSPRLAPGAVASRSVIADLGIERVRFANGVELVIRRTDFARDSISVDVRVGRGSAGRRRGDPGLDWTVAALGASGLGDYTAAELARFAAGRGVGYAVAPGPDALVLSSATNRADLAEALRVLLAGMQRPRIEAVALDRLRSSVTAGYASLRSTPSSALSAFGTTPLFGGDARFGSIATPAQARALSVEGVRRYWASALSAGPVRIAIVGDVDTDAAIAAVAASFGALPARAPATIVDATIPPPPTLAEPRLITHSGDPTQAISLLAWRTGAPLADLRETRALALLQTILRTRLNDSFREAEGGTYAPSVGISTLAGFDGFSQLVVSAQLTPSRIERFDTLVREAVADLAARGPGTDELERARETAVGGAERARAANGYWRGAIGSDLDDPRQLASIRTYVSGRRAVTADDIRGLAARYLADTPPQRIRVRAAAVP